MERIEHIDSKECKGQKTITIHLKGGNEPRLMLSPQVKQTRTNLVLSSSSRRSFVVNVYHDCSRVESLFFVFFF